MRSLLLKALKIVAASSVGQFKIPPKLAKNIKADGGFPNVKNWKAKVVLANNGSPNDVGTWDDVGYVGFEPAKGLLVPIARKDEHHTGYDLLDHYMDNKIIPHGEYHTIWVLRGQNYAHSEERVNELIPVYKKWLEMGGPNLRVDTRHEYMSFQDLVDGKSGKERPKGTLSAFGNEFISHLEKLAILFKKAVSEHRPPLKKLSDAILDLADFVEDHSLSLPSDTSSGDLRKAASRILDGEKIDNAMAPIFGFDGLKNQIHKKLKYVDEHTGDPKDYKYSSAKKELDKFFGDCKTALNEFNRISTI